MIDHSQCDHPRTSSARAKCRRERGGGGGKKREGGATPREIDLSGLSRTPGWVDGVTQTPSDPALCCDNCGVERAVIRGTDPLTGLLLSVGVRCSYMLRRAADVVEVP